MAKKKRDEGGGYNWMDTYGDLVTLLMCFFVMLFAMSSVNEDKWEKLIRSFAQRGNDTQQLVITPVGEGNDVAQNQGVADTDDERVNIETLPENFDDLYDYIKTYIEEHSMEGTVTVEKSGDNSVYIRFQDNIFFMPDSSNLMSGSTDILEFIGNCIKSVESQVLMTRVNGHTADPGIENYRISDRTLSTDRANSVITYFEEQSGIDGRKLMAQGYGKWFPISDNSSAEGMQRNRRVEMMIISNEILTSTEELTRLTEDLIGTADLFNDQMNTEGMLIPPSVSEGGEGQDGETASSDIPANNPENTPEASTPEAPTTEPQTPETQPQPDSSGGREIPLP